MSKKYLVITENQEDSSEKFALVFSSHDDAVDYINETIGEWGDLVREMRKISPDKYFVRTGNNSLTIKIKAYDSSQIRYYLSHRDHGIKRETRRFSSHANAVEYVNRFFSNLGFDIDREEIETGVFVLKENGRNVTFVLELCIVESSGGASKYHDILGVSGSASKDEIKSAYRKKAQETHPDHGGSEKKFQEVKNAYDELIGGNVKTNGSDKIVASFFSANIQYVLRSDGSVNENFVGENDRSYGTESADRSTDSNLIFFGIVQVILGLAVFMVGPGYGFWYHALTFQAFVGVRNIYRGVVGEQKITS